MALLGFFGPVECTGTAASQRNIPFINPPVGDPGLKLGIQSLERHRLMNHLNLKLLVSFAAVWAVVPDNAASQMMRQSPMPAARADMNPHPLLATEDQWINSIVDRWPSSQRKAWQSLNPRFRGWVSHLLWTRKNAGHVSVISGLQESFQIPSGCSVAEFVAPVDSVPESMGHFRNVMPDVNWNAWDNIEPKFRDVAEWEMSAEHARARLSKARKAWWDLNGEGIQTCSAATTGLIATAGQARQPNRYEQIDGRAKAELQTVDHMIAPEPIKQEAQERIRDAAAVDKYLSEAARRKL
jgi:hypothetical protein